MKPDTDDFEAFYQAAFKPCRAVLRRHGQRLAAAARLGPTWLEDTIVDAIHEAFRIARGCWEEHDEARASRLTWVTTVALRWLERRLRYELRRVALHGSTLEETRTAVARTDDFLQVEVGQAIQHTLSRLPPRQALA